MAKCSIFNCTNPSPTLSLHFTLPKDEAQKQAWLEAIPPENLRSDENVMICSHHFPPGSIHIREGSVTLSTGILPTLNIPQTPISLDKSATITETKELKKTEFTMKNPVLTKITSKDEIEKLKQLQVQESNKTPKIIRIESLKSPEATTTEPSPFVLNKTNVLSKSASNKSGKVSLVLDDDVKVPVSTSSSTPAIIGMKIVQLLPVGPGSSGAIPKLVKISNLKSVASAGEGSPKLKSLLTQDGKTGKKQKSVKISKKPKIKNENDDIEVTETSIIEPEIIKPLVKSKLQQILTEALTVNTLVSSESSNDNSNDFFTGITSTDKTIKTEQSETVRVVPVQEIEKEEEMEQEIEHAECKEAVNIDLPSYEPFSTDPLLVEVKSEPLIEEPAAKRVCEEVKVEAKTKHGRKRGEVMNKSTESPAKTVKAPKNAEVMRTKCGRMVVVPMKTKIISDPPVIIFNEPPATSGREANKTKAYGVEALKKQTPDKVLYSFNSSGALIKKVFVK